MADNRKIRSALIGAGCGLSVTLPYLSLLLTPGHWLIYLHRFPLSSVFIGILIDLAVVACLVGLAWNRIEYLPKSSRIWLFASAGACLAEAYGIATLLRLEVGTRFWIAFILVILLVGLVLQRWRMQWFRQAISATGIVLAILGCSVLWVTPNLIYLAARASGNETGAWGYRHDISSVRGPRLVWILLDELSYDQVYEHRWPGLALPNFDRLSAVSTKFTNVEPVGDFTRYAVPSLLLGRPATEVRSSTTGQLSFYMQDRKQWEAFDPAQTVFGEARRLGWTSGIVGYYNPYCRLFAGWVDGCYWLGNDWPIFLFDPRIDSQQSAFRNAVYPALRWVHALGRSSVKPAGAEQVAWHRQIYGQGLLQARGLIENPAFRFLFLHLPVPHPPGIYDRKRQTFAAGGSYLDNLALADAALGELLDELEKTRDWPNTTVVVCGDHSWRTMFWRSLGYWTSEDEQAARGRFDRRPVLDIHLAGQSSPNLISSRFAAYRLAGVLTAVLHGRVRNPGDLDAAVNPTVSIRTPDLSAR